LNDVALVTVLVVVEVALVVVESRPAEAADGAQATTSEATNAPARARVGRVMHGR
jgi:hypothetical protein